MAITTTTVTVTSGTAVVIAANATAASGAGDDWASRSLVVKNTTASAVLYLGPSGVTAADGFPWDASADGKMLEITLEPGEQLYAISAGASQTIHTMGNGR